MLSIALIVFFQGRLLVRLHTINGFCRFYISRIRCTLPYELHSRLAAESHSRPQTEHARIVKQILSAAYALRCIYTHTYIPLYGFRALNM